MPTKITSTATKIPSTPTKISSTPTEKFTLFCCKEIFVVINALFWCTFYRPRKYGGVPKMTNIRYVQHLHGRTAPTGGWWRNVISVIYRPSKYHIASYHLGQYGMSYGTILWYMYHPSKYNMVHVVFIWVSVIRVHGIWYIWYMCSYRTRKYHIVIIWVSTNATSYGSDST